MILISIYLNDIVLVRGTRTEYVGEVENGTNNQLQSGSFKERVIDVWPWLVAGFVIIGAVEIIIFTLMVRRRKRDKEE